MYLAMFFVTTLVTSAGRGAGSSFGGNNPSFWETGTGMPWKCTEHLFKEEKPKLEKLPCHKDKFFLSEWQHKNIFLQSKGEKW